jgi:hypothetical protein
MNSTGTTNFFLACRSDRDARTDDGEMTNGIV